MYLLDILDFWDNLENFQRIEPADAHVLEKFLKPGAGNAKLANGSLGEVGQREN